MRTEACEERQLHLTEGKRLLHQMLNIFIFQVNCFTWSLKNGDFFFLLSLADHVVVSVSLSLLILFPALTFEIIAVCVLVLTDRSFHLNY